MPTMANGDGFLLSMQRQHNGLLLASPAVRVAVSAQNVSMSRLANAE